MEELVWHVGFEVVDGGAIVLAGLHKIALLVHNRAYVGQTDPLLAVMLVKRVVNVVRVPIRQQRLRLLLLREPLLHGLRGEVNGACDPVKGQMQLVQLSAGLLVAELDGSFLLAFALDLDFVERLVQADNICCHFERQSFDAEKGNDYQDRGNDTYDDGDLDENFTLQLVCTLTDSII